MWQMDPNALPDGNGPSLLSHLECPECGARHDPARLHTICEPCASPLLARYHLARARATLSPQTVAARPRGLWRWHELLPVHNPAARITLGEGDSPLLAAPRLGAAAGLDNLFIKDESGQPTGSFKARGLCVAVAKAVELGVRAFVVPTAGNAGGALAAYAARAGVEAHVFMPADAPALNQQEVRLHGADLRLVDGLINDAGRQAAAEAAEHGWFDVSTLKEPYRLEGKKTMGLELAEQFGWRLPDVIVYPTGGGTGLVGMWKAFDELEALGWIDARRPRMVAVQAAGCAPVVRAFERGAARAELWDGAATLAAGLRVPLPFADRLILRALRESGGTAVAVSDEAITAAQSQIAACEGLWVAPEAAATLAGAQQLLAAGWLKARERVVLYSTGSGLKYA
jgi:threonine synthase